ncbi:peptidoglycan recognition protein 1-like [Macrosteles quadrilineatus]|uniref:peptidoglycan recognition protein 1-like n=1 Tax=Macrosteles quadrilineatus TaxID=74068 RepID=UPI0023E143F5|nr:peptidoglycan recognition protein 1-like [Macrosteles quadrilineatus]
MASPVKPRLRVVPRSEWSARPPHDPSSIPVMVHPVNNVLFTYTTGTPSCDDLESCVRVLKEIQERHMEQGAPDIAYNFLIGGDLVVYEGRGWFNQPEKNSQHPEIDGQFVEIAFIGDYTKKVLPYCLAKVALELVGNSIHDKYIASTYKLKESHVKLNFDEE